jgi:hypothetical protein
MMVTMTMVMMCPGVYSTSISSSILPSSQYLGGRGKNHRDVVVLVLLSHLLVFELGTGREGIFILDPPFGP